MKETFYQNKNLTSLEEISGWNVSSVEDMYNMFGNLEKITTLDDLSDWNTISLKSINKVFASMKGLTNIDALENWNVSNVTNFSYAFDACQSLTSLYGIRNWDVSNGTNLSGMFYNNTRLTQDGSNYINCWILNKSAKFNNMFRNVSNKPTFTFDVNGEDKPVTWDTNGTLIVPTE